jgi:hypothetical protein
MGGGVVSMRPGSGSRAASFGVGRVWTLMNACRWCCLADYRGCRTDSWTGRLVLSTGRDTMSHGGENDVDSAAGAGVGNAIEVLWASSLGSS